MPFVLLLWQAPAISFATSCAWRAPVAFGEVCSSARYVASCMRLGQKREVRSSCDTCARDLRTTNQSGRLGNQLVVHDVRGIWAASSWLFS